MIFQAWTPIDSSLTADAREQVSKAQDDKMAESVVDDVVELCKLLGPALSLFFFMAYGTWLCVHTRVLEPLCRFFLSSTCSIVNMKTQAMIRGRRSLASCNCGVFNLGNDARCLRF